MTPLRILASIIATTAFAMASSSSSSAMAAGSHSIVMYLTGQHVVIPSRDIAASITHVILAFLRSEVFHADAPLPTDPAGYPLFMTVDAVRTHFESDTHVMVAIGGWGDSEGFEAAAKDTASRKKWAGQVKHMVDVTGADGVDIDWEYPGGNRDDYKKIPNSKREWEIEAFVLLMQELRSSLGPDKLLSVAVPSQEVDLIAFTESTVPRISETVDFINVMAYELMNRRNTEIIHATGVAGSKAAVQRYIDRGAPAHKINLGLPYYLKWYLTQPDCDPEHPLGCPTQLMEDPATGDDLGRTGGFSWHDETPPELVGSFSRARNDGFYDVDGSYGYWDQEESRWWSYDTPKSIKTKMAEVVGGLGLGGAFAWGLGEDAPGFEHLIATAEGIKALGEQNAARDEL